MAFAEQDRVQIRYYLGYAALFLQADPKLEAAISTIQAVSSLTAAVQFGYNPGTITIDPNAFGGTRPDSSSENQVRLLVAKLVSIDAALDQIAVLQGGEQVGEIRVNSIKEDSRLRRLGRMYVGRLAKLLDTVPRADVFGDVDFSDDRANFRANPAYAFSQGAHRVRRAY